MNCIYFLTSLKYDNVFIFFREELEKCRNHLKMLQDELERTDKEIKEAEHNNQKYLPLFNLN